MVAQAIALVVMVVPQRTQVAVVVVPPSSIPSLPQVAVVVAVTLALVNLEPQVEVSEERSLAQVARVVVVVAQEPTAVTVLERLEAQEVLVGLLLLVRARLALLTTVERAVPQQVRQVTVLLARQQAKVLEVLVLVVLLAVHRVVQVQTARAASQVVVVDLLHQLLLRTEVLVVFLLVAVAVATTLVRVITLEVLEAQEWSSSALQQVPSIQLHLARTPLLNQVETTSGHSLQAVHGLQQH